MFLIRSSVLVTFGAGPLFGLFGTARGDRQARTPNSRLENAYAATILATTSEPFHTRRATCGTPTACETLCISAPSSARTVR